MAIQIATIPQQEYIAARPRREGLYDAEGWNDATAAGKIVQFQDSSRFVTASLAQTKQKPRDTNLLGGSALPRAWHLFFFGIRASIRALQANLGSSTNVVVFEEINRLRDLCGFVFKYGDNPYITVPFPEIPCHVPLCVSSTHSSVTTFHASNPVADRRNLYDVTISSLPIQITELEHIRTEVEPQAATVPSPTAELYVQIMLAGTLLKGLSG